MLKILLLVSWLIPVVWILVLYIKYGLETKFISVTHTNVLYEAPSLPSYSFRMVYPIPEDLVLKSVHRIKRHALADKHKTVVLVQEDFHSVSELDEIRDSAPHEILFMN